MILMQINQLVKRFGADTILKNIKLEIKERLNAIDSFIKELSSFM